MRIQLPTVEPLVGAAFAAIFILLLWFFPKSSLLAPAFPFTLDCPPPEFTDGPTPAPCQPQPTPQSTRTTTTKKHYISPSDPNPTPSPKRMF